MTTRMAFKSILLVCALFVVSVTSSNHKLVAYWGQNGIYHQIKELPYYERDLNYMCKHTQYDVIALAFLHIFFDVRNKDDMPALNFAYHCKRPVSREYPTLLRCPLIERAIKKCQKNGKKVVLSLGGEIGTYGFYFVEDAKLFAYRLWNLFLSGDKLTDLRPFGTAVIDGLDINAISDDHFGYSDLIREIRKLEQAENVGKTFTLSASTQCEFPDRILGPDVGYVLGDMAESFDSIFVQFRSVWCKAEDEDFVLNHLKEWLKYSEAQQGGMIFLGVPAGVGAAGDVGCYRSPEQLRLIYEKLRNEPRFGGIMLWDVGFDRANRENGKKYSDHLHDMLSKEDQQTHTNSSRSSDLIECSDRMKNCAKQRHLCDRSDFYGDFMKIACKRTCRHCRTLDADIKCRDYTSSCDGWQKKGYCERMPFMHVACRRSCRKC